jgi:predicted dehydrogenase
VGTRKNILRVTHERGWHAFCEKPFAVDARDHELMLDDGARRGLVLSCGYMRRFYWATKTARDLLRAMFDDGPLRLIASDCQRIKRSFHGGNWYLANPAASGGGFLMETGSHLVDQLLTLADAVDVDVERATQHTIGNVDYETTALGTITDSTGRRMVFEFALSRLRDMWSGIAMASGKRALEMSLSPGSPITVTNSENGSRCSLPSPQQPTMELIEAYAGQLLKFADRIEQGDTASNAAATGLLTTRFLARCYNRQSVDCECTLS